MEDPVGCANSAVDGIVDVLYGADDLENQLATALEWQMAASAAATLGRDSLGGSAPGRAPNVDRQYEAAYLHYMAKCFVRGCVCDAPVY
jgi:hypothetical protein